MVERFGPGVPTSRMCMSMPLTPSTKRALTPAGRSAEGSGAGMVKPLLDAREGGTARRTWTVWVYVVAVEAARVTGDEEEQGRYVVVALRRGLAILNMFRRDRRVVTIPEMTAALRLPRATAFRLAYTLERDGYLQRVPNSPAFRLGPKTLLLGFDYLHTTEVVACGRDALTALRDRTGFSTHMCVRDGTEIVYVFTASSHHRMRGDIPVGTRYPCHAVASGRALLFDMTKPEVKDLYRGVSLEVFS